MACDFQPDRARSKESKRPVFLEYEGPSLEGIWGGGRGVEDRWPASGRAVGLPLTVASFIHCGAGLGARLDDCVSGVYTRPS